jgi:cation transport regulator ChaB
MLEKSSHNGSKEASTFFGHETNKVNNLYNYNETNENFPQKNHLLKTKRGRKTSKINKIDYKIHDKDSPDNIRRKVKTHFHNFMVALLNMKMRQYFDQDIKFGKIAFKITQNLKVEYNRNLFKTKIKDIIIAISNKYSNQNMNKLILNKIMKNVDKNSELISLLNLNYEELYLDYYLKSNKETFKGEKEDESYEAHKEKLKTKFGNKYVNDFENIAESLINFFNNCKKRETKKKLKAPSFVNINDSVINYNVNRYELRNNHKVHKDKVDKQTQTEFYFKDYDDSFP